MSAPQLPTYGLWTPEQFGQFAQLTPDQVKKLRTRGDGPPYMKNGRTIRYVPARVIEWVRQNEVTSTTPRQETNPHVTETTHAPRGPGRPAGRSPRPRQ